MKQYSCYLFDVDGTLIDTAELIYQCFVFSCNKFAGIEVDRDNVIAHIGLPLRKQLEVYMGPLTNEKAQQITKAHLEFQLSVYKKHLKLFPDIAEMLESLKQAGKKIAAVTSRKQYTSNLYLKETGIHSHFDALVTPELTEKHKPGPEPALKAVELLNCSVDQAILVGDSVFDIECGYNAGMDTAFVEWSHSHSSQLSPQPTYIICDPCELTQWEA